MEFRDCSVSLEGNIGAGKSTVLAHFDRLWKAGLTHFDTIVEPVDNWGEYLKEFYCTQSSGSALALQFKVLFDTCITRPAGVTERAVSERSPYFQLMTFVRGEMDMLGKMGFQALLEYYERFGWTPQVVFYLRAEPKLCLERVQRRNRDGESGVTLNYLEKLHHLHEETVKRARNNRCRVVELDASKPPNELAEEMAKILWEFDDGNGKELNTALN